MAQVPLNEVQSAGSQSDSCVSLLVPLTWNLPAGRKSNSTSAAGNLKPPPPHNVNWMLYLMIKKAVDGFVRLIGHLFTIFEVNVDAGVRRKILLFICHCFGI